LASETVRVFSIGDCGEVDSGEPADLGVGFDVEVVVG